jgi:solute carrier family 25 protein 34/35
VVLQVKTHLQSQSMKEIAVGHQYRYRSTLHGLREVYVAHGLRGLWRGVGGAVPRLTVR